jgi:ATP-dependent Lon protease
LTALLQGATLAQEASRLQQAQSQNQMKLFAQWQLQQQQQQQNHLKERITLDNENKRLKQHEVEALSKSNIEKQSTLNDVHKSWQEQVSELSLKQIEIDRLSRQVEELQNQSQNDTESLLEERNEKKRILNSFGTFLPKVDARPSKAPSPVSSCKEQSVVDLVDATLWH